MGELLPSITELTVAEIEVGPRLRPVGEAGVAVIIASIGELGLMKDPIQVRRLKGGKTRLIAGGHRLEAARRLGWETIPVQCYRCTDAWARLMEVDDNLASAELTALDTALFLAERKRLYEEEHPETRQGNAGAAARWGDATDMMSFASTTAEKFGLTERHVRRLVHVGGALNRDQVRWLRDAKKPVRLVDLMQIAKIGEDAERAKVCIALANGAAKSAADARARYRAERGEGPAPKDPLETALNALQNAFDRAPKAARRQFVEANLDALLPLVREADLAQFTDLAAALTEALGEAPKE